MRCLWFNVLGGIIQEEIALEQADAATWSCKSSAGLTGLAGATANAADRANDR
jgi:hypothetical protein